MNDNKIVEIVNGLGAVSEKECEELIRQIRRHYRLTMDVHFPYTPSFEEDYRTQGYDLIDSGGMTPTLSGDVTIGFKPVTLLGDSASIGHQLLAGRAGELGGDRNQKDREVILANQDKIPALCRGKDLLFPKTRWRDRFSHSVCIPVAKWCRSEWFPDIRCLDDSWGVDDLLLVLC